MKKIGSMAIVQILLIFLWPIGGYCQISQQELDQIYSHISDGQPVTVDGTRATYSDGSNTWTIVGAVQENSTQYAPPVLWSVGDEGYASLVVRNPISDDYILPFSEPVPNAELGNNLSIKTFQGEYEPTSFIIRSGSDGLKDITVNWTDLTTTGDTSKIPRSAIDVRIVKCWYQSGLEVDRSKGDGKRLVPELLLHDNGIIKVDHQYQVNVIKNMQSVQDTDVIIPFDIEKKTNQQFWVLIHTPEATPPGIYKGTITVSFFRSNIKETVNFPLQVDVAPATFSNPPLEFALFYHGNLLSSYNKAGVWNKNREQLYAEMLDMKAHGLNNVAFNFRDQLGEMGIPNLTEFEQRLHLFREAGFDTNKLLFVDWAMAGSTNEQDYRNKIQSVKEMAIRNGFGQFYIYNKDESPYEVLIQNLPSFQIVHDLGGKNFVACLRNTALLMNPYLDVAILPRGTSLQNFGAWQSDMLIDDWTPAAYPTGARQAWYISAPQYLKIDGRKIKKVPGAFTYFSQKLPLKQGGLYKISYNVVSSSGSAGFYIATGAGGCVNEDIPLPLASGIQSVEITANGQQFLRFAAGTPLEFMIDHLEVSLKTPWTASSVEPWAYGEPQTGLELPGTYRKVYGTALFREGYKGICNFAYQTGDCWDDWYDTRWRPHVMAYPSLNKPIPTLQWEGFREAIDDIKHSYAPFLKSIE